MGGTGAGETEIDWSTFQAKLLLTNEVEKLVVTEGKIVKVFLRGQVSSSRVNAKHFLMRILASIPRLSLHYWQCEGIRAQIVRSSERDGQATD